MHRPPKGLSVSPTIVAADPKITELSSRPQNSISLAVVLTHEIITNLAFPRMIYDTIIASIVRGRRVWKSKALPKDASDFISTLSMMDSSSFSLPVTCQPRA